MESECFLCEIIRTHKAEVKKILERPRKPVPDGFRTNPIYQTPKGLLNLDKIETKYQEYYPEWNKKFQCFPEGPMICDKLFKKQPYTQGMLILTLKFSNKGYQKQILFARK